MSQRARIRIEAEKMLGPNAREAWQQQEDREQTAAGLDYETEFRRKSPTAKKAWDSVGKNPNAKPFVPMGGKRRYTKRKQRMTKRSKTKRNHKKRSSKRSHKKHRR